MAAPTHSHLVVVFFFALLAAFSVALAGGGSGGGHSLGWIPTRSTCTGSVAQCIAGNEFEMVSEFTRRILATTSYISYQSLRRNSVPCSRRGASYYNCRPGAEANPYRRGCSAITQCRT